GSEGQVLKIVSGAVQWAADEGGSSGVNSVTAGAGLTNSGTADDPVLDVNAGEGLGISTDQVVVNVDGTTIEIASDQLRVPAGGITATQLADAAVTGVKIAQMGATNGQVLEWNGTTWAPAEDDTGTTGITSINSQTGPSITISGGTAISVSSASNTITINNTGDTDPSNDLTTSTTFSGDVTGTYDATVVGDDSHNHTASTLPANTSYLGSSIESSEITDGTITAADLGVNVVSSVDGVTNHGGNIDLVAGSGISISPDDGANNITISATGTYENTQAGLGLRETAAGDTLHINVGYGIDIASDTVRLATNYYSGAAYDTRFINNGEAAGGDLSGNYPNPSVVDDSHNHTASTLPANTSYLGSSIESSEITDGTITAADIGTGAVGTSEIADGSVSNTDINNSTQFVDVYTAGSYRFSVTDGNQTLDFNEGTGIDISYNATGHDITITHQDMSSQGSVNNSNGTVIQDVSLDWSGHITGLTSYNLDNRYFYTGNDGAGSGLDADMVDGYHYSSTWENEWTDAGNSVHPRDESGSSFDVYEADTFVYLLYMYKSHNTANLEYGIYLNYNNDSGDTSNPSKGVYIWDGSNYQGDAYDAYSVRCGLNGYAFWGNPYSAGVAGFSWHDYNRSAGVLGGDNSTADWGALSYRNSGGSYYGAYWTSSGSGSGLLRTTPGNSINFKEGIGFGSYADLLGGWVRGEIYGLNVKGERYSLYIDGAAYSNQPYRVLVDDGTDERVVTYVNTSTQPTLQISGVGRATGGTATVFFDDKFRRAVNTDVPLVITVTPMGTPNRVYVKSYDYEKFVVEEIDGTNDFQFSWIVIGQPKSSEMNSAPEEIVSADYDNKMDGVMFNESILDDSATPIWWDGSGIRFEPKPPTEQEIALRELKLEFEQDPAKYDYNTWKEKFEALGHQMPMAEQPFKDYVKNIKKREHK
ncbi:hypothetical protein DRQ33_03680, partial [bacterium]